MNNDTLNEKKYIRTGFAQRECKRCYGTGNESMSIFHKVSCERCHGSGIEMIENFREEEMAIQRKLDKSDNDGELRRAWLFS